MNNISTQVLQEQNATPYRGVNKILSGSFLWMSLGLLVSGIVSLLVAITPALVNLIVGSSIGLIVVIVIELGVVVYLSRRISSMSVGSARTLFIVYAVINGFLLSIIFFAFNTTSIIGIFFATMALFIFLAWYGSHTHQDLTRIGRLAYFGLIGLVFAWIINFFIGGGTLDLVLSWIGVAIFTVLIAYDAQKIKNIAAMAQSPEEISKAKIIGALTLYLDFINLFLNLLRIFGKQR